MGKYDSWIIGGIIVVAAIGIGITFYFFKNSKGELPTDYVTYGQPFPREPAFKVSPHPTVNPYPYDYMYSEVPY